MSALVVCQVDVLDPVGGRVEHPGLAEEGRRRSVLAVVRVRDGVHGVGNELAACVLVPEAAAGMYVLDDVVVGVLDIEVSALAPLDDDLGNPLRAQRGADGDALARGRAAPSHERISDCNPTEHIFLNEGKLGVWEYKNQEFLS